MLKKTIKFKDYNGEEREENFYFNLNDAEITELELAVDGGWSEYVKRIAEKRDIPEIVKTFKKIIIMSYGIKSADGRTFVKTEDATRDFISTQAYSNLFMELITVEGAAEEFFKGLPQK